MLLGDVQDVFRSNYAPQLEAAAAKAHGRCHLDRGEPKVGEVEIMIGGSQATIHHGSVAIAAITSCTNTSNHVGHDRGRVAGQKRG
ncbi:MAG: hypothetical protein R2843_13320 [Thermomicrobiales bacterium]